VKSNIAVRPVIFGSPKAMMILKNAASTNFSSLIVEWIINPGQLNRGGVVFFGSSKNNVTHQAKGYANEEVTSCPRVIVKFLRQIAKMASHG
jgi:hypothetical protein